MSLAHLWYILIIIHGKYEVPAKVAGSVHLGMYDGQTFAGHLLQTLQGSLFLEF
jgi:hypothetical protein